MPCRTSLDLVLHTLQVNCCIHLEIKICKSQVNFSYFDTKCMDHTDQTESPWLVLCFGHLWQPPDERWGVYSSQLFISTCSAQECIIFLLVTVWEISTPVNIKRVISYHLLGIWSLYNTVPLFFSLLTLKTSKLKKVVLHNFGLFTQLISLTKIWKHLHQGQQKCETRIYR